MSSRCDIEGIVVATGIPYIKVETVPAAACAGCAGKMLCGSGRTLRVESHAPFCIGERVRLSVPHSTGFIISALLYGCGTLTGLLLAVPVYFKFGEVAAAVAFIAAEGIWFPLMMLRLRSYAKRNTEIKRISFSGEEGADKA